jgi:hypothetical protein
MDQIYTTPTRYVNRLVIPLPRSTTGNYTLFEKLSYRDLRENNLLVGPIYLDWLSCHLDVLNSLCRISSRNWSLRDYFHGCTKRVFHVPIKITFFTFAFITKLLQHSFKMDVKKSKIDKIVYHVSFIRHFVALTPSWHSSQARRALNPCVLQNTYYKTHIIIYYFLLIN